MIKNLHILEPITSVIVFSIILCVFGLVYSGCHSRTQSNLINGQESSYKIPGRLHLSLPLKLDNNLNTLGINNEGDIVYLSSNLLMVIDSLGILKRHAIEDGNSYSNLMICKDGGYLLWGNTRQFQEKKYVSGVHLYKLDPTFKKQWHKSYANHKLLDIQEASSGGFVLSLRYDIDSYAKERVKSRNHEGILKLNKYGKREWSRRIGYAARINIAKSGEIFLYNAYKYDRFDFSQNLLKETKPFDPNVTKKGVEYSIRWPVVQTIRKLSSKGKILDAKNHSMDVKSNHGDFDYITKRISRNLDGSFTILNQTNYTQKGDSILNVRTHIEKRTPMGNILWSKTLDDLIPKSDQDIRIMYRKMQFEQEEQSFVILYERYLNGKEALKMDIPDMWILRIDTMGNVIHHQKIALNAFKFADWNNPYNTQYFEPFDFLPFRNNQQLLWGTLKESRSSKNQYTNKSGWGTPSISGEALHILFLDSTCSVPHSPVIDIKSELRINLVSVDSTLSNNRKALIYVFHLFDGNNYIRPLHVYQKAPLQNSSEFLFYVGLERFDYHLQYKILKDYGADRWLEGVPSLEQAAFLSLKGYINNYLVGSGKSLKEFKQNYPDPRKCSYTFSLISDQLNRAIEKEDDTYYGYSIIKEDTIFSQGYYRFWSDFERSTGTTTEKAEDRLIFNVMTGIQGLGLYHFRFFVEDEIFGEFDRREKKNAFLASSKNRKMAYDAVKLSIQTCINTKFYGKYLAKESPWKYGMMQKFSYSNREYNNLKIKY